MRLCCAATAMMMSVVLLPGSEIPAPKWGTVTLPSGMTLSVEVADTPPLQEKGYMYREKVPEGEGMIFLLQSLDLHPFWMKNCRTALDIIWTDENWKVIHIASEVPPCKQDPCPVYSPMQKSHFVLEVAPGAAARLGLKLGDHITYLPPSVPRS
jgi:uncharacterized membrane protein (UPF0127 family)